MCWQRIDSGDLAYGDTSTRPEHDDALLAVLHFARPLPPWRAMELRVARHTDRLEEVVAFYRDRVGLPELGRFTDHDGYDGVFLGVPGTGSNLEFTAGGDLPAPEPHPESLLVLYLETQQELDLIAARLLPSEITPKNPYWQRTARAFADPDGYQLLLTVRASGEW